MATKKVRNDVYVTVTFPCVTGGAIYVTCYVISIFVTDRARNSMLRRGPTGIQEALRMICGQN